MELNNGSGGTSEGGVTSLNTLTGDIVLAAGTNVTFGTIGNTITINSSGSSGGTPGGLNAQIQYNNAGSFGGITGATTDGTAVSLNAAHLLNPTINGAGTGLATLLYPNTSTSVTITIPSTTGTLALTSQLTSGTVTSVSGTTNRITVATGTTTPVIDISASYVGQTSITTLGTITTGVWNGTAIANANLANSSITIGTTAISLGSSSTTLAGLTSVTSTAFVGALTGNASTATALATVRTIGTLTGDATSTGSSFDGTGNNTNALTLATVNSNVGSFTNATLTVNAKGLITAVSNGTAPVTSVVGTANRITVTGTTTATVDIAATYVGQTSITTLGTISTGTWQGTKIGTLYGGTNFDSSASTGVAQVSGGTWSISTALVNGTTATTQTPADNSTKVATTAYVAAALLGQDFKEACKYATTAVLPAIVYNNGTSGVGATLTAVSFGAITLDGSTPSVGDRILIKNQVSTFQNGIYVVTVVGAVATLFVLTRSADFNQSAEIDTGDSVFVTAGSTQATTTWAYNGIDSPTMGTDAITFAQTAGQGSFTAGNGISITGTSIAIDTSVTVDKTTAQTLTNKTLTSPILTTPALGTPTALVLTNATGLPAAQVLSGALVNGMTATTQTAGDNTTKLATTAFVTAATSGVYLLATGATTGATSQAQVFTNGVIPSNMTVGYVPYAESTDKKLINSGIFYDGTSKVGINTATPVSALTILSNITGINGETLALQHTGAGDIGISFQQTGIDAFGIVQRSGTGQGLAFVTNYYESSAGTELMRILDNGNVGIGTNAPTSALNVVGTTGAVIGGTLVSDNAVTSIPASMTLLGNYQSGYATYTSPGGGTLASQFNMYSNTADGFSRNLDIVSYGSTTGAISNIRFITGNGGTNEEVMRISNQSVGIGVTSPTAFLHLAAGTASASTAPLKFTSGTNLTTIENGAMEYNGTHLYISIGGTRYQLDQQSGGGGLTVGTSTITSGTSTRILYDNAGVLGEYTISGSGTVVAMANVATLSSLTSVGTITTGGLGTGATLGAVTVNIPSTAVGDLFYAGASNVLTRLADVATGSVLISGGVTTAPAWSTTPTFTGTNISGTAASLTAGQATAALGLKSATTTVAVSSATAPSSGQVLTATSSTAATWQTPSGGSTIPKMVWNYGFYSTTGRALTNQGGSGSITASSDGGSLETGATSGSYAYWKIGEGNYSNLNIFSGSPTFSASVIPDLAFGPTTGEMYFGIGEITVAGSGHTFTGNHIGFKILIVSSVATLYATQSDGTETVSSALTTIANNDVLDLILQVNGTSSVDYYWRKNGGSLSSATNLTTHIPTSSSSGFLQFSVSNKSTTQQSGVNLPFTSYQR